MSTSQTTTIIITQETASALRDLMEDRGHQDFNDFADHLLRDSIHREKSNLFENLFVDFLSFRVYDSRNRVRPAATYLAKSAICVCILISLGATAAIFFNPEMLCPKPNSAPITRQ